MFLSNYGAQDKLFIIRSFLEIMLHHATGTSIYRYLEFTLLTFSALAFWLFNYICIISDESATIISHSGPELFVRSCLHGDILRQSPGTTEKFGSEN